MDNGGWIRLFRKFREWEWYDDSITKSVWLEILLTANYEDKSWHGIPIKRGQLLTSIQSLRNGLKGDKKICPISTHQVRIALNHLKMTKEVTIETTPNYTLITVNKFNDYQQVTNEVANEWQTSGKRVATTKEYKNIKNINKRKNIKKRKDVIVKKTYTPPNLKEEDFIEISERYKVPIDFVRFQYDKMFTWAESNPNNPKLKGRNWKMTLMTFVRDDSLKIKTDYAKQTSDLAL